MESLTRRGTGCLLETIASAEFILVSTNLQCRHHLVFVFAIEQVVVILHDDEGSEVVADSIT